MRITRLHRLCALVVGALVLLSLAGCHGGARDGVLPSRTPDPACAPCQAGLRGDLNGSGTPDITDAVGILRIIVALDPANAIADCDCDGATGITDAIALLRCLVGFDPWPINCGPALGDELTGLDGQTLVGVPRGSFMMGSEEGFDDEQPVHQVTLDAFWIGRCEVTNDQYAAFLNSAQPADVSSWLGIADPSCGIEQAGGTYQSRAQLGQHPVLAVTWHGAAAYCAHYGYGLPTEAQWEYAAAGPNANRYPWGSTWDGSKCCWDGNTGPFEQTFPVGSFPAGQSWCGALDMVGNVWEWCADFYGETYYGISPGMNPTGPADGEYRVLRGVCWYNEHDAEQDRFRCAYRDLDDPALINDGFGFRCLQPAQ